MNVKASSKQQFSNVGCVHSWNCPSCYNIFKNIKPGRAICGHCGKESELTIEKQPVCLSVIINDGRG